MQAEIKKTERRTGTTSCPLGLKYHLRQCIYIHTFNNNANRCLSVKKEPKQQRREFNSHQVTLQIVNTAAKQAMR